MADSEIAIVTSSPPPESRDVRAASPASPSSDRKPATPRLLIVEDDYLMSTDLEAALIDAGFMVVGVAATADDAVMLAESERPALAIMDVHLRGRRDGIDAAIDIYSRTGIRCIFATAHHDRQIRDRAAVSFPLAWLPKPYGMASLVTAVRAALAQVADETS
ncbi:MAG: response regulator [Xanthobacteraceae bacterium]